MPKVKVKKQVQEKPEPKGGGLKRTMRKGGIVIGSNVRQAALKLKLPSVVLERPHEQPPPLEERKAPSISNVKGSSNKEKQARAAHVQKAPAAPP